MKERKEYTDLWGVRNSFIASVSLARHTWELEPQQAIDWYIQHVTKQGRLLTAKAAERHPPTGKLVRKLALLTSVLLVVFLTVGYIHKNGEIKTMDPVTSQGFVNQMLPYSTGNTSASAKFVADMYPYSVTAANGDAPPPTGGGVDPATQTLLDSYTQSINNTNSAIGNLGSQQQSGLSGIQASYQDALNQLLLGKNQASVSYGTAKNQSAQGYVGAKNTIGSQAGGLLNGLQRLLGSRGAGGGSAYLQAAPQAVTRGASLQRADVGNTFGQNNQALDTNWGNYLQGYGNEVNSAGGQKNRAEQSLQQSIDTNRASLLQSLAGLQSQRATAAGGNPVAASQGSLDQANSLLGKTYNTAPISVNTQAYQAPSLSSYNPQQQTISTAQNQGGSDYFSPYLQALLGKKQQFGAA